VIEKLEAEITFNDVSDVHRTLVNNFMRNLNNKNDIHKKEQSLFKVYYKLDEYIIKYENNKKILRIVELLKYRVALEILEL
jgi:hypothetical protein